MTSVPCRARARCNWLDPLAAPEPNEGDRAEHVLAAADVDVDVVSEDINEPGALLRLGVGEHAVWCP